MNILQINCVYGGGSTGGITRDLHRFFLARGHRSAVLYGRGPKSREPFVTQVCPAWYAKIHGLGARLTGVAYGGCNRSTRVLTEYIDRIAPDVVHLQCINGHFCSLYGLLEFLKRQNVPTVLTLHAEFPYTGGCSHAGDCAGWRQGCGNCPVNSPETAGIWKNRAEEGWRRLCSIYRNWDRLAVVGCSHWIAGRAAASSALSGFPVTVIANGVDVSLFSPQPDAAARLRRRLSVGSEERVVLFAAPRFSRAKGFDLFVQLARLCRDAPVRFLAAGGEGRSPLRNLTILGHISNREQLAELYAAADVLAVCSRQETFPTVCLEAAACGTPVIGFSVGGVPETILPGMGAVVPLGDISAMSRALLELPPPGGAAVARARTLWDSRRMARQYFALYQDMLGNGKDHAG